MNSGVSNLIHNGRPKGARNITVRILKQAFIYAAEKSRNSRSGNLEDYCLWLADDRPELFVRLLKQVLPIQVRDEICNVNFNTPLSEMANIFEQRIMSAYTPTIEHMDPENDCG